MDEKQEYSLIDKYGQRKYLNHTERQKFFMAINNLDDERRLFCLVILRTGMRISEALHLKNDRIDFEENAITIHSLKKKGRLVYRQVPVPRELIEELKHLGIHSTGESFWSFSRSTASRFIKKVMNSVYINGSKACAKGLRHSYAINCIIHNVPLTLIQKWMGHASINTTAIYLNVLGAEEREFAKSHSFFYS